MSICELKAKQGPSPLSIRPTTLARPSRNRANLSGEADGLELGREQGGGLDLPSGRVLRVDGDEPLKQASEPSDIGRGREVRKAHCTFPLAATS